MHLVPVTVDRNRQEDPTRELTPTQDERIAPLLPKPRGNVNLPKRSGLNAIGYVVEHGGQ